MMALVRRAPDVFEQLAEVYLSSGLRSGRRARGRHRASVASDRVQYLLSPRNQMAAALRRDMLPK
jgi:hypothetical protein